MTHVVLWYQQEYSAVIVCSLIHMCMHSHIKTNTCNLHMHTYAYTHTHIWTAFCAIWWNCKRCYSIFFLQTLFNDQRKHDHCTSRLPNPMLLDQFHNSLPSDLVHMTVPCDPYFRLNWQLQNCKIVHYYYRLLKSSIFPSV